MTLHTRLQQHEQAEKKSSITFFQRMTEAHLNRMQTTKTEQEKSYTTVKASKQKMPPSPHPPVTGKTSKRQKTDKKQENNGLHDGLHAGK